MIYLAHADPLRKDMLVQADFLVRSHKEVGIKEPLVILKTNEKKKFKKYGAVDDYPIYNRYIAVIEYIENNRLENETICLLDCDMFFHKPYKPILVNDDEIVSQKWIGAEHWQNYWNLFNDPKFDIFKQSKIINLQKPDVLMCTPYYMKGKVYSNLYKITMKAEEIIRKTTKWWMTEQLCLSYAAACLNLKIKYDNLAATFWFVENPNENISGMDVSQYPLIHYCCPIRGKNGKEIKKYKMEDTKYMLSVIDDFVKTDTAYRQVDIKTLEFLKKMYGYKG